MTVAGVFLRNRQAPILAVLLALLCVLVYFGGDMNLPVPGAPVPIVLGALAPLIAACIWVAGLDAQQLRWAEAVAPRRIGPARCGYAMCLASVSALVIVLAGSHSVGVVVSIALVRSMATLIGLAAAAWWLIGARAAYVVVVAATMVQVVAGGRGAADGEIWAPWALMFADPVDLLAATAAIAGILVAAVSAWAKPN